MKEIPIAKPSLGAAEAKAASEVVLSGWVTQGPRVKAFEDAFAVAVGARHACAVSSGTVALHLGLLAVGVRPGDVVITVSHSFIATANAVRYCQAEPVFVEIDAATLNMDPAALHAMLERDFERKDGALWYRHTERLAQGESPLAGRRPPLGRLGAILLVHQVGMPADLARILPLARAAGAPVVEDAACAIGSEFSPDGGRTWQRIGRPHAGLACFSFHPRKVLTTGDGGMLTTNDPAIDAKLRLLRHHGMSVSDLARHQAADVVFEEYETTGFNYRLTDIQAAVGAEQLRRLAELVAERRRLAGAYHERLGSSRSVTRPQAPAYARSNWQSYIVRLKPGVEQRAVMQALKVRGIQSRRGVMCAHLEAPYRSAWPRGCLPQSEAAHERMIVLPLFPGMSIEDIARVVDALHDACV